MSKKSKKNLQKILAKRQQLQQISSNVATELLIAEVPKTKSLPVEPTVTAQLPAYSHNRELIRTTVSIGIIIVLLVAVIIFDRQRNELETFGNWLYQTLRLNK